MTDTELYEIVRDMPRELWPEELEWGSGYGWHRLPGHGGVELVGASLALLIWEGKLSRVVVEAGHTEDFYRPDKRWNCNSHKWYPTRIETLVAAVKE